MKQLIKIAVDGKCYIHLENDTKKNYMFGKLLKQDKLNESYKKHQQIFLNPHVRIYARIIHLYHSH